MKFGELLKNDIITEWSPFYIPYRDLKALIREAAHDDLEERRRQHRKGAEEGTTSARVHKHVVIDPNLVQKSTARRQKLLNMIGLAADTAESFYKKKVGEYQTRMHALESQARLLVVYQEGNRFKFALKKLRLRHAVTAFLTDLDNLKSFARLNYVALRRIYKRYDQLMQTSIGLKTLHETYDEVSIRLHSEVDKLTQCATSLFEESQVRITIDDPGEEERHPIRSSLESTRSLSVSVSVRARRSFSRATGDSPTSRRRRSVPGHEHGNSSSEGPPRARPTPSEVVRTVAGHRWRLTTPNDRLRWVQSVFGHLARTRPKVTKWVPFWIGFSVCGIVLLACFLVSNIATNPESARRDEIVEYVAVFRVIFLPSLLFLGFVGDRYAWKLHGVNDRVIFQTNPSMRLSVTQMLVFQLLTQLVLFSFANLVFAALSDQIDTSDEGEVLITCMLGLIVLILIIPLPRMYRTSRTYIYTASLRAFCAPFFRLNFIDFFIADQWTSLSRALVDGARVVCYYANGFWDPDSRFCLSGADPKRNYVIPLVAAFPYWVRWWQCLRRYHDNPRDRSSLSNLLKFTIAMSIIGFSAASKRNSAHDWSYVMWIVMSVVGTCYSIYWDLARDWGLTLFSYKDFKGNGDWPLREKEKMLYPKSWYYAGIGANIVLRLGWVFTISPEFFGIDFSSEILTTVLSIGAVMRRCIWNLFRVENEHVNNVGQFRAELRIDLPFSDADVEKDVEAFNREFGIFDEDILPAQTVESEGETSEEEAVDVEAIHGGSRHKMSDKQDSSSAGSNLGDGTTRI